MFGKTFFAVAFAAAAYAQSSLSVNSISSLITCQPALISWSGGTAPYFLAVIPGGQPSAAALKDFGQQTGNSLTWNVDIAAGTSVTIRITDSTGNTNYNQATTIQQGSTSCIGASSSGSMMASSTSGAAASASSMMASSMMASASASSGGIAASVSSASRAVASGASSVAGAASSVRSAGASAVSSGAAAAASSARPSGAASLGATVNTGVLAVVIGAIGVAAF